MGDKRDRNLLNDVVHTVEGGVRKTVDTVEGGMRFAVGTVGKVLHAPISLAGSLLPKPTSPHRRQPGASPGIEQMPDVHTPPEPGKIVITCWDYGPDQCESRKIRVRELKQFWAEPRPEWSAVRWINVDGLNPFVVREFKDQYNLHTLAAEDVLHVPQRPKVEPYDANVFTVARMTQVRDGQLDTEQISFFLLEGLLITFQETQGDVWDAVRERLDSPKLKIRKAGADYLLYALLDAMVDHAFPLLERYSDKLESLEGRVMVNAKPALLQEIHQIKRDLSILRRVIWPMRDVLDTLYRDEQGELHEETKPYMRDVYDHAVQVLDIVETYREMASGLGDLYMNMVSHRMNEVMKVLTIIATLFIPITFIAGVYGMNFEYIPELGWKYAYPTFWGLCVVITIGLLIYFRRKRWL